MLWNPDSINRCSQVVKMCDFDWYWAVGGVVVRAVFVAKLGTEGGWMECVRGHGGIGTLSNGLLSSWD